VRILSRHLAGTKAREREKKQKQLLRERERKDLEKQIPRRGCRSRWWPWRNKRLTNESEEAHCASPREITGMAKLKGGRVWVWWDFSGMVPCLPTYPFPRHTVVSAIFIDSPFGGLLAFKTVVWGVLYPVASCAR